MHCEGKLELRSHNTSYCWIEVVTKADLTVLTIFDKATTSLEHLIKTNREDLIGWVSASVQSCNGCNMLCKFWSADDSSLPSISSSPPEAGKKKNTIRVFYWSKNCLPFWFYVYVL